MDWQREEPVRLEEVRRWVAESVSLRRNPASRFSFIRQQLSSLSLFVDGQVFDCDEATGPLVEEICARDCVDIHSGLAKSEAAIALLAKLLDQGSVTFGD